METNGQKAEERLCPKCGHRQMGGEECEHCGIIFRKFEERSGQHVASRPAAAQNAHPQGVAGLPPEIMDEPDRGGFLSGRLLMMLLLVVATAGTTYYFTKKPPEPAQSQVAVQGEQRGPVPNRPEAATAPANQQSLSQAALPMSGNVVEDARNATVSVLTPWGQGSGFFILDTYIVTNKHVVEANADEAAEMRRKLDVLRRWIANERERQGLIMQDLPKVRDARERDFLAKQMGEWQAELAKAEQQLAQGEERYRLFTRPLAASDIKVRFADGQETTVYGLRTSSKHDLAVLMMAMPNQNVLKAATEQDGLRQGDRVFAIGNPSGLSHTVTAGVFSGYREDRESGEIMLQTDAPINPGNSGGPLLDEKGRVHGVNTLILRNTQGIGFAIPIKAVFDDFNLTTP